MAARMDSSADARSWAFLYARNRETDYAFALLPRFIKHNAKAQDRLGAMLGGEPQSSQSDTLDLGSDKYRLYFCVETARTRDGEARDASGRLITLSRGLIWEDCNPGLRVDQSQSLLRQRADELEAAWRHFWAGGRRPEILESDPAVIGKRMEPERPDLPPDPGRPWRLWSEIVVLVTLLLIIGVEAIMFSRKSSEIALLEEQLEAAYMLDIAQSPEGEVGSILPGANPARGNPTSSQAAR